jgi:glycosyltransferase involved in cell wall biosynthesis
MTRGLLAPAATNPADVPRIAPRPGSERRPEFSVAIPTHYPGEQLLAALRSVLAQDPGPQAMQIAVVDDASPDIDLEGLVARVAPSGRVEVHRNRFNLKLAGNWNRCIEVSRGELVHILHQDDFVSAGFYEAMSAAMRAAPGALMAFCRCSFVDEHGARIGASRRRAWRAGIARNWLARISEAQRVQCPGVVVRRSTYETLGGYRSDLQFALDWEMWVRIAAAGDVWYEPRELASYRWHEGNITKSLERQGITDADTLRAIQVFSAHLPAAQRERLLARTYREFVRLRLRHTRRLLGRVRPEELLGHLELSRRLMREFPAAAGWRNRARLRTLERRLASAPDSAAP